MAGSHLAIGAAAWMLAAPHLGLAPLDPPALTLACAGAILPDIDHPRSWLGHRLRPLARPIAATIGHRGLTHSIFALVAALLLLRWQGVSRALLAPLAVGYLSHLAADLITPAGLPLAWPFRRRFALPLCRTGSPAEFLIAAGFLVSATAASLGLSPFSGL
ncbi:MAG: metal-dependent hydrolase [Rhodospirillales bacterium]|nr:metal-dependent hydrolase [Rhodospirillales bacterium]